MYKAKVITKTFEKNNKFALKNSVDPQKMNYIKKKIMNEIHISTFVHIGIKSMLKFKYF